MIDRIRRFFDTRLAPAASGSETHRLHLATAALMLEVGRADFHVRDEELAVIADALRRSFGLSDAEVDELLDVARAESDDLLSLHPLVRLVNENFDAVQKRRMVEDLWRVACADGHIDAQEEYQIRKIADLLYVPHVDFIRAKHRAMDEGGEK
ncbi:MAG: TerB family tellurite resistance protein [Chromatiales bacterium]|jgi:uncharacterized tellurite resistance protein B-like protein|nr:TerB family tellurite resistance protein [Chromatiales bacterium]MDX9767419.1 TerB family tellurite resistance protein [Ectothiorhodospiraceae bacterium]